MTPATLLAWPRKLELTKLGVTVDALTVAARMRTDDRQSVSVMFEH